MAAIAIVLAAGITMPLTNPAQAQTGEAAKGKKGRLVRTDAAVRIGELQRETIRFLDAGRVVEAEPIARQALVAAERAYGEQDLKTVPSLNNLVKVLQRLNRMDEVERLNRRILAIREQALAENHPDIATSLNNLATVLQGRNRLEEAERLHRRALAIWEQLLPDDHPDIALSLNNLAAVLSDLNQLDEAERLYRRALAIREQVLPENDPDFATSLSNLATVLQKLNRLDEAERLYRRALAIQEQVLPENHTDVAITLNNLADVLLNLNRLDEAERLLRRALAIRELVLPENHPDIAWGLINLAVLLQHLNRLGEAEPLHRRALAILERVLPENHSDIASSLGNLAGVLQDLNRLDEAEQLLRRALAIREQAVPENHPDIASDLNNLAALLQHLGRLDEAERLLRRALAIRERASVENHPDVAVTLSNLGSVLQSLGRPDEAERLQRRALAIRQQALPENHPDIAMSLNNLAITLGSDRGAYQEALGLLDRARGIFVANKKTSFGLGRSWRDLVRSRIYFARELVQRDGVAKKNVMIKAQRSAFIDLQWELSGGAGGAIAAAAARAQADPEVASLARERDKALREVEELDNTFLSISSSAELDAATRAQRLADLRAEVEEARQRLTALNEDIVQRFPAYAELAEEAPLAIEQMMPLLKRDEVLVSVTPDGTNSFFFAYSRGGGIFAEISDAADAAVLAGRLRCSAAGRLDPSCAGLEVAPAVVATTEVAAVQDASRGAVALGNRQAGGDFDLDLAHDLYNKLFPEAVRGDLRGKKLIIAPAPELMGLPWHLLVIEAPPAGWNAPGADRAKAYREAKWLFQSHPSITVLPTVASLRALRGTAPKRAAADRALLGVGDPVIGRTDFERDAPPMECGSKEPVLLAGADPGDVLARSAAAAPGTLFSDVRDGDGFTLADPDKVREQPRLADTRCELAAVAAALGRSGGRADLLLGHDATEARIRELDGSGELGRYRVLHFATHGLLGGELGLGEPGLVLTPPDRASARDDGILTASEISTLTLAADWVVLSACNTAAGSANDAEALSGLARSFFYAGARSLLVSSWPVYSPAAVDITTRAFDAMDENPRIGRAEALTIAMRDTLAAANSEFTAHPAYWAPFFLVGEGAR